MSDPGRGLLDVDFDGATLKSRSVHGAAATFVAQALKFVLRFGSTIVLARLLSPAEFGLVAMVAPILALVLTFNDLGVGQAIIQRQDIDAAQVSALFWINLLISAGLTILLLAVAPAIAWVYGEPRTSDILMVMASLVIVGTLGMVPTALLSRQMRFVSQAAIDIACTIANVVVSVGAAWLGYSYWSLVFGQVAASVLNFVLVFAVAQWRPSPPANAAGVGSLVRFGVSLTGVNLATYFTITADNMIVGVVVGKTGLGIYDRSYSLVVQPLGQLMYPVSRVAIPLLSRLVGDPDLYRRTYADMLRLALVLTVPGMLVAIIFARPMIHYLLGDAWRSAAPVFAWLCVGGLAVPLFASTNWIFITQARTQAQLAYSVATAIIGVGSFALGVVWGIYGVAVVAAISFVFIQTPLIVWGSTRNGLVSLDVVVRAVAPLVAAGLATSGVLLLLPRELDLWELAGALALSYSAFAAMVFMLPGGRALLSTIVRLRSAFA